MKQSIYFLGMFLIVGCSTKSDDFTIYTSQIKSISASITFRTIGDSDYRFENNVDKRLFGKFKCKYANEVLGKVYENEQSIGIIYIVYGDVLTPVLLTYDKRGNRVDSLNLLENASGFNPQMETFVSATLNPNRTLLEIDSSVTYSSNGKMVDDGQSSQFGIDSVIFVVNKTGQIIQSKQDPNTNDIR